MCGFEYCPCPDETTDKTIDKYYVYIIYRLQTLVIKMN